MPSISFLGTGSGFPSGERFFSSSLLIIAGKHLLVDAGEPCVHLLRYRGDLICEIDAILISHGHVDHVGGVPALLQGAMMLERKKPLVIYLPQEMITPLRAWIRALYLTEEGFGFSLVWRAWNSGLPSDIGGGISVTPHLNSHLKFSYQALSGFDATRPCQSFSLEVVAGDFRALFSGDLSSASELMPMLTRPTDVLVTELSHFSADQLADVLGGTPVHSLCLVHLSEEYANDRSGLREKLERLLPSLNDVMVPEDGEVLDF